MAAPATFYTITGGNVDTYWRSTVPQRAVGAKAATIANEDLQRPTGFSWPGRFSWIQRGDGAAHYPHHEGTAVWTRPCLLRATHAAAMREDGHRVLAEVDDNYLSAAHLNMFMKHGKADDETRLAHLQSFWCFDGIVFSTAWLRDRYAGAFKKAMPADVREFGQPEFHVARNHTLLEDWPARDEGEGTLRVGYMGSTQHMRDLKIIAQAFHWAKDAAGCETILMGHNVRDQWGLRPGSRAFEETKVWDKFISRHIPWIDTSVYHRQALPFDIGLAPLELNDHTMGKSDVKAIEYAISGAVPVLQNHPVYAKHWRHNETCLLASSRDDWTHCVLELIKHRSLRERLVSAAQAYVREERSDVVARKEWSEAIAG